MFCVCVSCSCSFLFCYISIKSYECMYLCNEFEYGYGCSLLDMERMNLYSDEIFLSCIVFVVLVYIFINTCINILLMVRVRVTKVSFVFNFSLVISTESFGRTFSPTIADTSKSRGKKFQNCSLPFPRFLLIRLDHFRKRNESRECFGRIFSSNNWGKLAWRHVFAR